VAKKYHHPNKRERELIASYSEEYSVKAAAKIYKISPTSVSAYRKEFGLGEADKRRPIARAVGMVMGGATVKRAAETYGITERSLKNAVSAARNGHGFFYSPNATLPAANAMFASVQNA